MMTAKEILTSCRDAVLELRKLDAQLARCLPTGQPPGVKAQQYNADPPGTNDPTAAAIQLYDGLMAQREELFSKVDQLRNTAWNIVRVVAKRDIRNFVILNDYYLLGMTDQEIAQAQELTRAYITQLRHAALESL